MSCWDWEDGFIGEGAKLVGRGYGKLYVPEIVLEGDGERWGEVVFRHKEAMDGLSRYYCLGRHGERK